ncbi:MAG: hypothetical protein D3919_01525 [Candidatus Electrothrix sp. AW5]|nr:hypothetical protein [Candidatus Electrothrix sp. AX1]MCI5183606.1 hypothetical protein [Candidatus Electrothrix gigas]MCI5194915.1 hypothetical protein [Candidatus Electrothrix gigas]
MSSTYTELNALLTKKTTENKNLNLQMNKAINDLETMLTSKIGTKVTLQSTCNIEKTSKQTKDYGQVIKTPAAKQHFNISIKLETKDIQLKEELSITSTENETVVSFKQKKFLLYPLDQNNHSFIQFHDDVITSCKDEIKNIPL